ncbi:unnamed protein product [Leptidea sinapis]|uniref:Peptidase M16 N-terminal domain-containing protein n=1 Tax=Leptidea sinapis TaxID=189913 RepID=A0A5E4PZS2_9NEOP|nr:unnamed protein product [Leptidea sinapis]
MSHFKLISSTKASDVVPVHKYVSQKTGITVIIAGVEGPVVNGFFCLATEAHDDDGLPHTLEHLIFLGSQRYPYKGILDLLANRCMAHGTNAWTDTDHTCYTINTAGDAGMLTLLPIYLDHILNPTLTDQGFTTEVHHVDGDGEDAGVVYCEMQGRENTSDSRCELRLVRAMYPNSGYSSETGGIMKNLRESTNNTKVKDYHKKFYRAENLTIILTGQIEAEDVFKALATVEDDIIGKRDKEPQEQWVKPWQTIPPPPNYGEFREQWPVDIEDCGQVSYGLTENMAVMIKIELDNVPIAKLEAARTEAKDCLRKIRSGEEIIDMDRMKRLLKKQLRESIASLESDPHHAVAFRCIGDALYSQTEQDFILRLNPQQTIQELLEESSTYWLNLLQKYFTDELVTVIGSPSVELQTKMADEEKKRLEEQRSLLGESGLAEKAQQLDEAMRFNEREPPAGTLASVPIPSCDNLKCYQLSTWSSDSAPCPHFDLAEVPLYTRLHSLKTNLVRHVVQVRRNGHKMVYDTLRDAVYSADSNVHWASVLRQTRFLRQLVERAAAGGESAGDVVREARAAWHTLTEPARLWLHLAADLTRARLSPRPWKRFAGNKTQPKLYNDADLMSGWGDGFVVGVGGMESSFLAQLSPGPPRYTLEQDYLRKRKFDEELFASAKSTALFEVVDLEKCPADVVRQSLLNYIKRVDENYNRMDINLEAYESMEMSHMGN